MQLPSLKTAYGDCARDERVEICRIQHSALQDLLDRDSSICRFIGSQKCGSGPEGGKQFARFLGDLDFGSQPEIARPTTECQTLMNDLPLVFVGSAEKLVKIIELMSDSARRSLNKREPSIPRGEVEISASPMALPIQMRY